MVMQTNPKVTTEHLKRNAYLYVRQSTLRQISEHKESTKRQYNLEQRAMELGWPSGRVVVIDSDLGQSGASSEHREGFQKLVGEVAIGNAGIVLGLEVSRLARNNCDWHRLLEICGLSNTLILDEDGLYDPCDFNDRLLLGLKGTMSEAELHILKARMRGGIMSKARRGELEIALPAGFVYSRDKKAVFDPDKQVRECINLFFEIYRRTGSARAVVKQFREQNILFPRRLRVRINKGKLVWKPLDSSRALDILHNPRYAGAFAYGRKRSHRYPDGRIGCISKPRKDWYFLLKDIHKGYISWQEYEENQRQLQKWTLSHDQKRPPREGSALLQGLAICGLCGGRMSVHYNKIKGNQMVPNYVCTRKQVKSVEPICQFVAGKPVDEAIEELLLEVVTPMTLDVALNVQEELQRRLDEADRIRKQQIERAHYEAELARNRYMQVDPNNRLVADSLENEWNEKLSELNRVQQEYERRRQTDRLLLDKQRRAEILSLATDFPRLWKNPNVPVRERKRMIRFLIEDVTLIKGGNIVINIRFKGGATRTLSVPKPELIWKRNRTKKELIEQIDTLLDNHINSEIANILNERGLRSGSGLELTANIVRVIVNKYGLKSRYDRLREKGLLTLEEISKLLNLCPNTAKIWHRAGWLKGYPFNEKGWCLFEPPNERTPVRAPGRKRVKNESLVSD
jgi:DNA invertase Pin-like site-specific DNA recombinase